VRRTLTAPPSGFCNPRETRFAGPETAGTRQYNSYELFRWNFAVLHTTKLYLVFNISRTTMRKSNSGRTTRWTRRKRLATTEITSDRPTIDMLPSREYVSVDRGQRIFDRPTSMKIYKTRERVIGIFSVGLSERKKQVAVGFTIKLFPRRRHDNMLCSATKYRRNKCCKLKRNPLNLNLTKSSRLYFQ